MHPLPLLCGGYREPLVLLCVSRDPEGIYAVGTQFTVEVGVSCALCLQVCLCVEINCAGGFLRFEWFCLVTVLYKQEKTARPHNLSLLFLMSYPNHLSRIT